MVANRIFGLAGLPRSGSTLLGSILNQNPLVNATPTSPLYSLLVNTCETFRMIDLQHTYDTSVQMQIYRDIVKAFHPDERDIPIVFEKHRGWPRFVEAFREFVDPDPRIICTVRSIPEVIASYITLAECDPDNFIDAHLRRDGVPVNYEARAMLLWTQYLNVPHECLTIGLKRNPQSLLLVEYDDLVFEPQRTLARVYAFCGMEPFEHDFSDIESTCAESKDEAWGLRALHEIRPALGKISVDPLCYLPQSAIDYFRQFDLRQEESWL